MATVVYPEGERWAWCCLGGYGGGYATKEDALAAAFMLGSDRVEVLNVHPSHPPATLTTARLRAAGSQPHRQRP